MKLNKIKIHKPATAKQIKKAVGVTKKEEKQVEDSIKKLFPEYTKKGSK